VYKRQQLEWLKQIKFLGLTNVPISCDTFDIFAREKAGLVRKVMNSCDLSFLNKNEYEAINGKSLNGEMVLKLGEEGAEYLVGNKTVIKVKTNKTLVKDTTGAGDIVAGIFLALSFNGIDKKSALKEACRVATMSVNDFGVEHLIESFSFGNNLAIQTNRD
jgi:sugar/nucleoside kinase (ribokinase family)